MKQFARPALGLAAMVLGMSQPLAAQSSPQSSSPSPSLPSSPQSAPAPVGPPPAWTVAAGPAAGAVRISATATDGGAMFVGGCSREAGPGMTGSFSGYAGTALGRIDGESERVLFEVSGEGWKEAFAVQLRYVARSDSWDIEKVLAPVFVSSFSRGGELTVLNSRRQEVFSFDLTGSSAAARAMRDGCGFQYGATAVATG